MNVFALVVLAVLSACSSPKPAQSVERSSNGAINVGMLFEFDGCKVYRFFDYDRPVYFTSCGGTQSSHTESCGKSCRKTVDTYNEPIREPLHE